MINRTPCHTVCSVPDIANHHLRPLAKLSLLAMRHYGHILPWDTFRMMIGITIDYTVFMCGEYKVRNPFADNPAKSSATKLFQEKSEKLLRSGAVKWARHWAALGYHIANQDVKIGYDIMNDYALAHNDLYMRAVYSLCTDMSGFVSPVTTDKCLNVSEWFCGAVVRAAKQCVAARVLQADDIFADKDAVNAIEALQYSEDQ